MKITIKGPYVTPDSVREVLADLETEFDLKIRDMTMYIRFLDEKGRTVEPMLPANASELVMTVQPTTEQDSQVLTHRELMDLFREKWGAVPTGKGIGITKRWIEKYGLTREEAEIILEDTKGESLCAVERRIVSLRKEREP